VDKAFIGIGGVDLEAGLTEYNTDDAQIKRTMIRNAQRRILLSDSRKFGLNTFASVAPLSVVTDIVTDDGLSAEYREALEREGITVHIAALTGEDNP